MKSLRQTILESTSNVYVKDGMYKTLAGGTTVANNKLSLLKSAKSNKDFPEGLLCYIPSNSVITVQLLKSESSALGMNFYEIIVRHLGENDSIFGTDGTQENRQYYGIDEITFDSGSTKFVK